MYNKSFILNSQTQIPCFHINNNFQIFYPSGLSKHKLSCNRKSTCNHYDTMISMEFLLHNSLWNAPAMNFNVSTNNFILYQSLKTPHINLSQELS